MGHYLLVLAALLMAVDLRTSFSRTCQGTYGLLNQHLDQVGRTLRAMRIGRRDRIAVVLPNGPEMVVAFLAILIFNRPRRHFRS